MNQTRKSFEQLVEEHPRLRLVMKRFQPDHFLCCGVVIASHPPDFPGIRVYGDFVIDRGEVKCGSSDRQVKQDFLIFEFKTGRLTYYSGRASPEFPRTGKHINEFGKKFKGTAHYGMRDGSDLVGNHHYSNEMDDSLPNDPVFRQRIALCIGLVRGEFSL